MISYSIFPSIISFQFLPVIESGIISVHILISAKLPHICLSKVSEIVWHSIALRVGSLRSYADLVISVIPNWGFDEKLTIDMRGFSHHDGYL